jgi:GNAT superfamily N-acetyltransferase
VNKQDGLIACLDVPATRLNSIWYLRQIACRMFECQLPRFSHRDRLIVEGVFPEVRICYVSLGASNWDDRTSVDCRFHFDSRHMWIRSIHVPACRRRRGVGRQLVAAVEATAHALGMEEVRLLPMASSVDFWLKLNYAPDSRSARVLWKNPAVCAENSNELTVLNHQLTLPAAPIRPSA